MTLRNLDHRVACLIALTVGILICSTASAEGWGWPSLNPFAEKSKAPTSARVSDDSGFSLLPKWGGSKKRSSGPSTWSRMTSALNPWAGESKASVEPSPTGSFNPFATASTKKQADDGWSFLPSWTTSEEKETREPQSVNDFLKQDRLEVP